MRQIVEAIDQNPPGLSTVINEDPQLRKLAQTSANVARNDCELAHS